MRIVGGLSLALFIGLIGCTPPSRQKAEEYSAYCDAAQDAKIATFTGINCQCFGRMLDPVHNLDAAEQLRTLFNHWQWVTAVHVNGDIAPAIETYLYGLLQNKAPENAGEAVLRAGHAMPDAQRVEAAISQSLRTCRH